MNPLFAVFEGLFGPHILILLIIGILLFGKRLPEVGRSLGKGIVEFKKGLKGLEDDIGDHTSAPSAPEQRASIEPPRPPQRVQATAPKFEDTPNTGAVNPPPQV
ncbi:MAG TPA: twin-arginine translocase TatA/TatE family subunit [Gemmataceae bacterium]|nr:twin-arginine translocase TatA/TatE family subunit [Gemmataceae bacterium]